MLLTKIMWSWHKLSTRRLKYAAIKERTQNTTRRQLPKRLKNGAILEQREAARLPLKRTYPTGILVPN